MGMWMWVRAGVETADKLIMASFRCVFNAKQFYETLSSTKGIAPQLLALRLNFEKGDIAYIFQGTLALQEVLQSSSQLPLTKYNALLSLQELLRTAAYPALSLVELLLLPLLTEVTAHQIRARTQDDTDRYFVEKGFRDSIGIRKVGRRYVLLAVDILFGAAAVRPYLNILHQELPDLPSKFALAAKSLKEKGVQPNEDELKSWQLHRLAYLKHLAQCDTQQYADFVTRRLREDIVYRQGLTPQTRKLLESEDPFITMPACNACVAMLSDLTLFFPHKRHYLSLLSNLVKSGDAYAIVVVHNGSFVKDISEQIAKVRGDQNLSYGKLIYPNIQASLQDKLDFYCEFMRCLETWAICLPYNEIGEPSEIAALYHYLKEDKRFHFPQNSMVRKIQQDFHENLKRRQSQNEEVLRIVEGDSQLLSTCLRLKSTIPSALGITHPHSLGPPIALSSNSNSKPSTNDSFQDLLQEVSECIGGMGQQRKIHEQMYYLREFQREWPQLRQTCLIEHKSKLVSQGDALLTKIQNLFPLYVQLQKKTITFEAFKEKAQSIMKSSSESSYRDSEESEKGMKPVEHQKVQQFSAESERRKTPLPHEVSRSENEGQGELACWSKNSAWLRPSHQDIVSNVQKQFSFAPAQKNTEFLSNKSSKHQQTTSKKQQSASNSSHTNGRNELNQFISFQQRMAEIPIEQSELITLVCKEDTEKAPCVQDQQSGQNEYGIRQLLIKRKKYLREAKESSLKSSWSHILPSSLEEVKAPSTPDSHSSSKVIQLPQWIASKRNGSPSTKTNPTFKSSESKVVNVTSQPFEVYQISRNTRNDTRDLAQSRQNTINRSRNLLERIAYSSTSKAIRAYGEHVSRSSSRSSRDRYKWLSADKSNSRSIIKKQYTKFISRQQQGNMSQGPSFNTSSRSNLPSSMPSIPHCLPNQTKDLKKDSIIQAIGYKNNSKLVRCCLKNKGVLYSSPELEVGFVHFRRELNLDLTIYITTNIAINVLKIDVQSSQALFTRSEQSKLKGLVPGQQESFKIQTCPMKIPYKLPKLTLTWSNNPPIVIPLPCTFNKYIQMKPLHSDRYYKLLPNYNKQQAIHFGFELSRKMSQKETMLKLLPHLTPWDQNSYLCECIYQRESFLLELMLKDGRGKITGRGCSSNTLEYLVSTFCFLFAK